MRWLFVLTVVSFAVAALANVFGQRPTTTEAAGTGAVLRVEAPPAVRGGLLFQARFELRAERALRAPTLALDAGWFDGLTLNTVEPEPTATTSEDGGVAFEFGRLAAGRTLTVYYEFQVNPTTVGRRSQDVVVRDGTRPVAELARTMTIFP